MAHHHILRFDDAHYPVGLRHLQNPPARLWLSGCPPQSPALAIVGTRAPSQAGLRAATLLTLEAVDRGWCTVAGLAAGVDDVVHRSTVAANGRSWAFIGAGVDRPEHPHLARRLVRTGGGIMSEHPPGSVDTAAARRSRDRLQAAVSTAVIVVEASAWCGTLHTVAAARRLGRPIVVVRPHPDHPAAAGSRQLLRSAGTDLTVVDIDDSPDDRWALIHSSTSA